MSHHGIDPIHPHNEALIKKMMESVAEFRGALGEYPAGKLSPSDEGSIQFAVGEQDGKVILDFGTPVKWIGMTAQEAADLASTILDKARFVGRKNGETVSIRIGG